MKSQSASCVGLLEGLRRFLVAASTAFGLLALGISSASATDSVVVSGNSGAQEANSIIAAPSVPPERRTRIRDIVEPPSAMRSIQVWLYTSSASQMALMRLNADPTSSTRIWENYLRSTGLRWARVNAASELASVRTDAVLILPSKIVLSDSEKRAILNWRDRGGSVLSTWKTGTHAPDGRFLNFDFMRDALDVNVLGDTAGSPTETFMVLSGDNPISHSQEPGLRIWMERVPGQLPLRLSGKREAAQMLDWSRSVTTKHRNGLIAYNDRVMPSGKSSRVVTVGFPEQNWQRADPQVLKLLSDDVFSWLLRRPRVYIGHWPYPYRSATLVALKAVNPLSAGDVAFASGVQAIGGRVTAYVLASNVLQSLNFVRQLQAQGHEIGYFGDAHEAFAKQPATRQAARMDAMRQRIAQAGVAIPEPSSFATPSDVYDQTTLAVLMERGFGNFLGFTEISEGQVPTKWSRTRPGAPMSMPRVTATWMSLPGVTPTAALSATTGTLVLPRTLIAPEDAIEGKAAAEGIANFLRAYTLSHDAAALSVVRIPAQSFLVPAQRRQILDAVGALRTQTWIASASQISNWWRARSQISLAQTSVEKGIEIQATVAASSTVPEAFMLYVDLPSRGSYPKLEILEGSGNGPSVVPLSSERAALVWRTPSAGKHRWRLSFEPA